MYPVLVFAFFHSFPMDVDCCQAARGKPYLFLQERFFLICTVAFLALVLYLPSCPALAIELHLPHRRLSDHCPSFPAYAERDRLIETRRIR